MRFIWHKNHACPTIYREHNWISLWQPELPNEALLAAGASVARKNTHGPPEGNKRLALVDDAALQLAILDGWYSDGTSIGTTALHCVLSLLTRTRGRISSCQKFCIEQ